MTAMVLAAWLAVVLLTNPAGSQEEPSATGISPAVQAAPSAPAPEPADEEMEDEEPKGLARAVRFAGKFHPATVHFPIGVILVAAIAELLGMMTRKALYFDAARFMVVAAAIVGAMAGGLGWAEGAFAEYAGKLAQVLTLHRWLGTSAAALMIATAIVSELSRSAGRESLKPVYRSMLFATAILISVTGYFGGALVHGLNHYQW